MTESPIVHAQAPPPDRDDRTRPAILGGATIVLALVLWMVRDLVVLVGLSVLLAYALDPLVTALEPIHPKGRGLPRPFASAVVMLVMVLFAGIALAYLVPQAIGELVKFLEHAPQTIANLTARLRAWGAAHGLSMYLDPAIDSMANSLQGVSQNASGLIASALGRIFGSLAGVLAFLIIPLLSFYLLAESDDVRLSVFRFIPPVFHTRTRLAATAIDRALRSYVRGQAMVCLVMGTTVGIALAVLRFPYALFLAVLVGLAEVVPYLGYLTASLAIILTGFTMGPLQALFGFAAYTLINNLVGMLVTPRLMGRYLEMHPFVVTISVLLGGRLLGPGGVLLALPVAAIVQSLMSQFAQRAPDELIVTK